MEMKIEEQAPPRLLPLRSHYMIFPYSCKIRSTFNIIDLGWIVIVLSRFKSNNNMLILDSNEIAWGIKEGFGQTANSKKRLI